MSGMVRMVATSEHVYAGRALGAGDEFDCESQHVELMKLLGRACIKEAAREVYQTRDLVAVGKRRKRLAK